MSELKAEQWLDYAGEPRPCYPKSEADKVIAHNKYKRCLAMAQWCNYWANYWEGCEPSDCGMFIAKARFYRRWRKRWLELAKEPTWAKFLQLIHKETK